MALAGKLSHEFWIKLTASKIFDFYTKQLDQVQHITDQIHVGKLHQGQDWHHTDTVKHWTYTVDGKVLTCLEKIEIDERNKVMKLTLFGGDVAKEFKKLNLSFHVVDSQGGAIAKWTVDYETINGAIKPPFGYIPYLHKITTDTVDHFLKA